MEKNVLTNAKTPVTLAHLVEATSANILLQEDVWHAIRGLTAHLDTADQQLFGEEQPLGHSIGIGKSERTTTPDGVLGGLVEATQAFGDTSTQQVHALNLFTERLVALLQRLGVDTETPAGQPAKPEKLHAVMRERRAP